MPLPGGNQCAHEHVPAKHQEEGAPLPRGHQEDWISEVTSDPLYFGLRILPKYLRNSIWTKLTNSVQDAYAGQ